MHHTKHWAQHWGSLRCLQWARTQDLKPNVLAPSWVLSTTPGYSLSTTIFHKTLLSSWNRWACLRAILMVLGGQAGTAAIFQPAMSLGYMWAWGKPRLHRRFRIRKRTRSKEKTTIINVLYDTKGVSDWNTGPKALQTSKPFNLIFLWDTTLNPNYGKIVT